MEFHRSKEWWLKRLADEPDCYISAGVPDPVVPPKRTGLLLRLFLWMRAKCAYLWRIGVIKRTTAFRWEMDRFLGEYTHREKSND